MRLYLCLKLVLKTRYMKSALRMLMVHLHQGISSQIVDQRLITAQMRVWVRVIKCLFSDIKVHLSHVTITYTLEWLSPLTQKTSWWRHQMETFSVLLALCKGNSPASSEFPSQRPVMQSFGVFFDMCLNKRLSKQSWGWWFETPSLSLWCHCNDHGSIKLSCNHPHIQMLSINKNINCI